MPLKNLDESKRKYQFKSSPLELTIGSWPFINTVIASRTNFKKKLSLEFEFRIENLHNLKKQTWQERLLLNLFKKRFYGSNKDVNHIIDLCSEGTFINQGGILINQTTKDKIYYLTNGHKELFNGRHTPNEEIWCHQMTVLYQQPFSSYKKELNFGVIDNYYRSY
ncbi:hypothetical protein ACTA71_005828 [Dictyostelium dimigraforme]